MTSHSSPPCLATTSCASPASGTASSCGRTLNARCVICTRISHVLQARHHFQDAGSPCKRRVISVMKNATSAGSLDTTPQIVISATSTTRIPRTKFFQRSGHLCTKRHLIAKTVCRAKGKRHHTEQQKKQGVGGAKWCSVHFTTSHADGEC